MKIAPLNATEARPVSVQPPMTKAEWFLLLLVLLIGGWLRVSRPGLSIWGGTDGAELALGAVRMAAGEMFTQVGLVSSLGVHQPPLVTYLLTPFFAINPSPWFVSVCISLLNLGAVGLCYWTGRKYFNPRVAMMSAVLFATAPWAIIRGRSIWPQDLLPVFGGLLAYCWCAYLTERRAWQLGGVVAFTLIMAQIHLIAAALILAMLLVWLLVRPPVFWRPILVAVVLNVVLFLPYLVYQLNHNWVDVRQSTTVLGKKSEAMVFQPEGIHPQFGFPFPSQNHAKQLVHAATGGQIEDVLGLSLADFHREPGMASMAKIVRIYGWMFVLVWVGALILLVREAEPTDRFPYVRLHRSLLSVLVIWIMAPLLFLLLTGMRSYLSYFLIVFPAVFLLAAVGLDAIASWLQQRGLIWMRPLVRHCFGGLVGIIALGQIGYVTGFYQYIERIGGPKGVIFVPYRYQEELANYIAAHTASTQPVLVEDWPPRNLAPPGIRYLVWLRLKDRTPVSVSSMNQPVYVIVDTRFGAPNAEPLRSLPYRSFGALRLYEVKTESSSSLRQ